MATVLERFLDYVSYDTQSDESTGTHPSTEKQRVLARHLAEELSALGLADVRVSEFSYVYGVLPATPGQEEAMPFGLIAHMDTAAEASGADVRPQVIQNWDGQPIALGTSGLTVTPNATLAGTTIVTTDGTTLLGADDKAGIAVIVSALAKLVETGAPHGKICVAFTPDEEIGEGADNFDVAHFGADMAYTLDGGSPNVLENENFNAATAIVSFTGAVFHPGGSYGRMVNAQKLAMEFDGMLPPTETPAGSRGHEGFYHLLQMSGNVGHAELKYLIRDFETDNFAVRKKKMQEIAARMNKLHGENAVRVEVKDSYYNMKHYIDAKPLVMANAIAALEAAGIVPKLCSIRGGTDGAHLAEKGLVCPNLGNGSYNVHGEREYASLSDMERCVEIVLKLAEQFAKRN